MNRFRLVCQEQIVESVEKFEVDCATVELHAVYRSKAPAHCVEEECAGSSNDPPFSVRGYRTSKTQDCATPFFEKI